MKEGLLFLHNSFRIFYFIEFPHLVFGSPRLLLDFLTAVTVHHIKLTTNPDHAATSTRMWKQYKDYGIITKNILVKISDIFDKVLTPQLMLEVMERLLIICKVDEGAYMMTSLLTALASLPKSKPSLGLQWLPFGLGSDITMLIHFPIDLIPFGVYCSTVCELISGCRWELIGEVSRSKFCFTLPNSPGVVSLNDSFDSFFVLNLEILSEFSTDALSSICTEIRKTILNVINEVIKVLKYTAIKPVMVFLCEHDGSFPHVAEYLELYDCLRCIKDKSIKKPLNEKHQLWLRSEFHIVVIKSMLC